MEATWIQSRVEEAFNLQVRLRDGHRLMGFGGELGGAETMLRGPWDGMTWRMGSVFLALCLPSLAVPALHPGQTETALPTPWGQAYRAAK